jgi:hypothetical protein
MKLGQHLLRIMSKLIVTKLQGISQSNFEITIPSTHRLVVSGLLQASTIQSTGGVSIWTPDSQGNLQISGSVISSSGKITCSVLTASGRLNLPVWTTSTRPTSNLVRGTIGFNTQLESVELWDGTGWRSKSSLGETSTNPASSAAAILAVNPSAPDGVYWLNHGSGAYQAYCYMSAGGYILVGKIPSTTANNTSWSYGGSNWSSTSPVNESTCTNIFTGDGLNRGWYEYTLTTGFLMGLGTHTNNLNVPRTAVTARNAFTGSQFNVDSMTRQQFMTWFQVGTGQSSSNFDNQPSCNRVGFNRTDSSATAMRFGITMNNEADCNTNDSAIGFGTYTNNDTSGIRNIPAGGHRWNPDQKFPAQGYIFVK